MSRKKHARISQKPDGFSAWADDDAHIGRERNKARELRASQWWKRQCARGRCYYCEQPTPASDLTMDHIVPLSRGGMSVRGNVVPCCKTCNTQKRQLLPIEWEEYLIKIKAVNLKESHQTVRVEDSGIENRVDSTGQLCMVKENGLKNAWTV